MFDFFVFLLYNYGMGKISGKLEKVYNFTIDFINQNGYSPSIREICEKCDIKSTSSAFYYVEKLKNDGLLVKSPLKKRALSSSKRVEFTSVPILGSIRAGAPLFAVENLDGYIPLPKEFEHLGKSFALRVQGDSMINAGIKENDVIIVREQETAENGEIVVALIEDSATVKRFYLRDGKIILHPENDDMQDMIFEDVKILGIVKGLIRKF